MNTELIKQLQERQFDQYLAQARNARVEAQSYSEWAARIRAVDQLVAGDFKLVYPNQIATNEIPMVQNLAETMVRDVPRLVGDASPTVRSYERNDSEREDKAQQTREAIAMTHWDVNQGDLAVPLWTMDLLITGAAFAVTYVDEDSIYPCFERIDPRYCYPDIHNRKLLDLVVIQTLKLRQAAILFPQLGLDPVGIGDDQDCEILDYYSQDRVVKAVAEVKSNKVGNVYIVDAWEPRDVDGKPFLPVAYAQLPSHDGAIRGLLDQVGDSLIAKNKIARLMVKYAEQQVAAPLVAKGVINIKDKPGPNTIYQLDPNIPDAQMGRVQPSGGFPQLFALLGWMDTEQRGEIAYPAMRQGLVSQSIASGSFVSAGQGQLSSVVREVQSYLATLREKVHENLFKLEEKHLNFSKPLLVALPASRQNSYTPLSAIKGVYRVKVNYGATAGLDRIQADVRLIQLYGAGILDAETVRENLEFVEDPNAVEDKWERDQIRKALMQKFVMDPAAPFDLLLEIETVMQEGKSFSEAIQVARARMAEKAQTQAEAQPAQAPQAPMGPAAEVPAQAIEKGATSPEAVGGAGEVQFNPPPMEQIFVRAGGG